MTDLRMRSLSRLSASGDLHAQARLLVERLRAAESCVFCSGKGRRITGYETLGYEEAIVGSCPECCGFGSVLRARVTLAAYASHEPAALALEETGNDGWKAELIRRNFSLEGWLKGLSRWSAKPFLAPVRAGYAAAHLVATHLAVKGMEPMQSAYEALDAVEAWLVDPSPGNRDACGESGAAEPRWIEFLTSFVAAHHGDLARYWIEKGAGLRHHDWENHWRFVVPAHPGGEPAIRTAIQQALVKFALGDS